jgi:hypothetical protein
VPDEPVACECDAAAYTEDQRPYDGQVERRSTEPHALQGFRDDDRISCAACFGCNA